MRQSNGSKRNVMEARKGRIKTKRNIGEENTNNSGRGRRRDGRNGGVRIGGNFKEVKVKFNLIISRANVKIE